MSTDIISWKTKVLNGLRIPISAIRDIPYVTVNIDEDDNIEVPDFEMTGTLDRTGRVKVMRVESIRCANEGTGYLWDALKTMLAQSTGELAAVQVWESGDITSLVAKDGLVTETEIEL